MAHHPFCPIANTQLIALNPNWANHLDCGVVGSYHITSTDLCCAGWARMDIWAYTHTARRPAHRRRVRGLRNGEDAAHARREERRHARRGKGGEAARFRAGEIERAVDDRTTQCRRSSARRCARLAASCVQGGRPRAARSVAVVFGWLRVAQYTGVGRVLCIIRIDNT